MISQQNDACVHMCSHSSERPAIRLLRFSQLHVFIFSCSGWEGDQRDGEEFPGELEGGQGSQEEAEDRGSQQDTGEQPGEHHART